ncbi:MAG: Dolichyl-phosphate-mannose-protein mannosyltransferase-domain-containing protein [Linnemannia gamsii]|nr:MAG: Dolichyl-phosphate-mannose-protein mannosyltransferase-domain-containing protein [Linnemannia gamsii]
MTKKNNSSKKSKQKTPGSQTVSITDPAVFAAQDEPTTAAVVNDDQNTTNSNSGFPRSTSFASSHASLLSLADLDNVEPTTTTTTKTSSSSAAKMKNKTSSPMESQQQQQKMKEAEGDDLWSWITATYNASGSNLEPKQQQKELNGAQEEEEKKQAKSSWNETRRLESQSLGGRDWVALSALTVATMSVRLWRMDGSPGEVVLEEAYVGKYVNGYLNKEFTYDIHPPLGKLLLAGISSWAGQYDGSFGFEEVGDAYGDKVPFMAVRIVMAVLGALCAPMAYVTLRNKSQSAPTAILATLLIALDNALVANNRLMSLESPLMFFTALAFMSWTMFTKQSQRPFGIKWWLWLVVTGLAASAAMSTKLSGALTVLTMGLIAGWDLWGLIRDESVSSTQWAKHCMSRITTLAVLPVVVYTSVYYLHFQLQTNQPHYLKSVHGDYDLTLLSPLYRHSLRSPYKEDRLDPVWSDIVYGSVIQLQSESQPPMYVHSPYRYWPNGSKQVQVAAYEYPDLSNHWIVIRANLTQDSAEINDSGEEKKKKEGEIPVKLQHLHHRDWIRLRHIAHRHCMHSHDVRTMGRKSNKRHCEVSGYGNAANDFDGDQGDWWRIEIVNVDDMTMVSKKVKGLRVKALETAFRLRHYSQNCHLHLTGDLLEANLPGGEGRVELSCLKDAAVLSSSIWRFSMNDHDYLPAETELAAYPKLSFWRKFKETHKLIRTKPRAFDMNKSTDDRTDSSKPLNWLLRPTGSPTLLTWRSKVNEFESGENGHVRQISLVPNPVSWVIRTIGLVLFFGFHFLSALRYQRGYFDGQDIMDFKAYHLSNAGLFFTAWALHFLPLLAFKNSPSVRLTYRDYFPALYFSVLMSCTILSGIMKLSAMPRLTRAGMWLALTAIAISAFIQLSPLTYGTFMTPQQCASLASKINPVKIPDPGYAGVAKGTYVPLIQPTLKLDCTTWKQQSATPQDQSNPKTFAQFKNQTELHVSKPFPRKRAPHLESIFPRADEALPMSKVFMTPCQRPPQLWEVNRQDGQPNAYQRQQMQHVLRKMEKEEATRHQAAEEEREKLKRQEEETRASKEKQIRQEDKKAQKMRLEKERVEKEKMEKERAEKARLEEERQEKERIRMQRLEKERLEREQMEMTVALEDERQWLEDVKVFNAQREKDEAEKRQELQRLADKIIKETEMKEAENQAKEAEKEAERQRLHRKKVAFEAAARATEIDAASKVAGNVFMAEVQSQAKKKAQEMEQAKLEEAERAAKNPMPSRQDFRESFFKRAEMLREDKLKKGFKFANNNPDRSPELALMGAFISMAADLAPQGARARAAAQAGAGPLGGMGGLGDIGGLGDLGGLAGLQKEATKIKKQAAAAAKKPAKLAKPAVKEAKPLGNVEALENLIDILAQAQKAATARQHEQQQQRASGKAPPEAASNQPSLSPELLEQIAGLEQLSKNGGGGSADKVVSQLDGLARVLVTQQQKLNIDPENLAGLQGAFVELLNLLKEQEEMEKRRNKKRKW